MSNQINRFNFRSQPKFVKPAANDRHTMLPMRDGRRRPERRLRRHQQARPYPRVRRPTSCRLPPPTPPPAPTLAGTASAFVCSADRSAIM